MKLKNSDLIPQIFIAVVSVIIVGIIIHYVMNSVKSTTRLANTVIANTEEAACDYIEYELVKYDGEEIRGSEIVNLIKKKLGDYLPAEKAPIYVEVITKDPNSFYNNIYNNNAYINDIKNFSSIEHYIKPTAMFAGEVIRTENRVIIGVKFTQR
ncbi:MAG: hypothetical protein GX379_03200 [Clostridiales bacterium]|nr:hypothetical protein [Clostridiales bacterium]